MKIVCLIPAFNEQQRIASTVQAVRTIPHIDKVVVVDDGSDDQTGTVAQQAGAELLTLSENLGKGQALNSGWHKYPADIYLFLDADLETSARQAAKLITPVANNEADMTIADFQGKQTGESKKPMGFGAAKNLARWGIKRFTGFTTHSPLSGQRCLTSQLLKTLDGVAEDFGVEVDLTIRALRYGFRVQEIPVEMAHRPTGRGLSGFLHRGRQFLMVLKMLVRAARG